MKKYNVHCGYKNMFIRSYWTYEEANKKLQEEMEDYMEDDMNEYKPVLDVVEIDDSIIYKFKTSKETFRYQGFTVQEGFIYGMYGDTPIASSTWYIEDSSSLAVYFLQKDGSWKMDWIDVRYEYISIDDEMIKSNYFDKKDEEVELFEGDSEKNIVKRIRLAHMPFAIRFGTRNGNEELCNATGYRVAKVEFTGDCHYWNEYIDSYGKLHYGN